MHASPEMEAYFAGLEAKLKEAIGVANEARAKGIDPRTAVEIPVANDLADRVEALLGYTGVAARLRELAETMPREEVALKIGDDFIAHMFGETTREETLDHAIRTSMALLTEGVVAAPTEGIAKVGIGKNDDGTDYLKIYYAGPIRSAGGTAQALSVLVGDYVRRGLGMAAYIPRKEEVERYVEEVKKYNSQASLQYLPTDDELRVIIKNCPVCVEGEPTERVEVSGYRNLERIETNTVRGGMALVVAEGLALKAPKIKKTVDKVHMEGWDFLDIIISGASKSKDEDEDEGEKKPGVKPKDKYIRDLIAGRPVFSYPMRAGGFRLRYGRSRNTGFAAAGFNPATLHLLGNFLAVGTQMKVERPGKAAGVVPVDSIEGPTVKLTNGSVLRIDNAETALRLMSSVEEILDVGEMLVSYGEFLENNHPLIPPTYCEEWWRLDGGTHTPADETEALAMAAAGGYLHPAYTYVWDDITTADVRALSEWVAATGNITAEGLTLPADAPEKRHLEILLVPHTVTDGTILIDTPKALCACLGLTKDLKQKPEWETAPDGDGLTCAMHLSGLKMRSRAGIRIGGRMGRPGKSKAREMRPPPHVIFPVGDEGGSRRSFQGVIKGKDNHADTIQADVGRRRCPSCGQETYKSICSECDTHTEPVFTCPRCSRELKDEDTCPVCGAEGVCQQKAEINIKTEYTNALTALGMRPGEVELLKGVRGLISKERPVEPIEKGLLRQKNNLYVFKDGTLRYDMIDLPLTHIRPNEIGVSVERLVELGYPKDIDGEPLTRPDQVLELRAQDILVSEDCAGWLLRVAKFIDEMLVKLYGLPPYYNAKSREDIVGQLVMGLAPHTSAGVLARVIGVSKAPVGYAHPYFHAAKRRNCFAADTMIEVFDGAEWRSLPIGHFVVENFDLDRPGLDQVGTYYSDPKEPFWVHALDTNGAIHLRQVTSVSIHRAPDHLIRFTTSRGKHVTVTPDHAMLVSDFAYQRKVRAMELKEGDHVPVSEGQMMVTDQITAKEYIPNLGEYVYCLTVAVDHTLAANGIFTGQCDGDEDCVMLLMDGLINFSRSFLPETRGGSMDAPLVLTTKLDPAEVDGESHNVDACSSYPIDLYNAALEYRHPKELSKIIDHLENRLGTPGQYEGVRFTHDTSDISAGPLLSTYTTLTTMTDKLEAEFELGRIIRAVDEDDVAERVLKTHFIPDMQGNLNAFSRQKLRCPTCNAKYRRMPMAGKCRCGGKIIQTVHEGSVKKYIDMSRKICTDYNISEYTRQRIEMLDMYLISTFGEEKEIQLGLADFM
ncbi:DNA-directed DNA polymerase II large subunit [Methanogenium organophilum]|uniref:DNA polymerase II large subunit n=1 Tax=Methanogenium organophilum TaxID=2199 RepID=A0A9X9T718_METOG|nr:DNA-directed DNA polymerase II large subunit [Methanogenium organophilum]WAI00564.1 DNA-directed DNA polymerase II large subunit [Methanogenium organophilum]